MLVTKDHITELLPQRPPILMVDNLVAADKIMAHTDFTIASDNLFVDDENFTEPGLVENIAQTAAVQLGYLCSQQRQPVPLGYIAAIKNLEILQLPKTGSKIDTIIRITNKVLEVTIVEGEVRLGDELLCSCEMRIFLRSTE